MSSFSPQELELALRECAAEPIHQIGKIQPNGVLLVLSKDSPHTVFQASDNLANFLSLSVSDVIGKSLASLLGEPATLQIEQLENIVAVTGWCFHWSPVAKDFWDHKNTLLHWSLL